MGRRLVFVALAAVGALLLAYAAFGGPALWLDEAQSVAFARLPLTAIPRALRQDGAPPLYYLLLHLWMRLFGDGDAALRSLSAIFAAAFVAAFVVLALRLAGRRAAVAAGVITATNPFVVRYAGEVRMYTLVMLEVALGALALAGVLRGGRWAIAGLALSTAALLYTHYWGLYLAAATAGALAVLAGRDRARRREAVRAHAALAAGGVLWLPWLPSFRYQSAHTGTPWRGAPSPGEALYALFLPRGSSVLAGCLAALLVALAVTALRRRGPGRFAGAVFVVGATLAFAGAAASSSAFVPRYTAAFAPLLLLLAAAGAAAIAPPRLAWAALAAVAVLGTASAVPAVASARTRAPMVATALSRESKPGDLVVYCPDQLGPAVSRLLDARSLAVEQQSFPPVSNPRRVDWVDYGERYRSADPAANARSLTAEAGPTATIWLVWSDVYPPTQPACHGLKASLSRLRPVIQVLAPGRHADHDALWRYDPATNSFATG